MDLMQASLEAKIKKYQKAYYAGSPLISDADFDRLWDELKEKYPNSSLLREVGSDLSLKGKKFPHIMKMGSQEKFNTPEGLHKWLVSENIQFPVLVEYKQDGISCELQYQSGVLVRALTRGNGDTGEDITSAVKTMRGVPLNINPSFSGAVRGEIEIENKIFKDKYAQEFKNPRNFVAGAVKNEKFQGYEDITLISYDVFSTSELTFPTEIKKMEFLQANKFVPVFYFICRDENHILLVRDRVDPKNQNFAMDGLVLKQNVIDPEDAKELRPRKQRAFKWLDEGEETTLLGVEWTQSGATFTPVALLEPVDIEGSTVSRASLANPSLIKDLNLKIGDTVLVTKRGMIIPKIEKVVKSDPEGKEIEFPTVCPTCGKPLSLLDKALVCSNGECPSLSLHRISKWLEILDVKGFGDVMQKRLVEWNITQIPDLYNPTLVKAMIREYGSVTCASAFNDLYKKSQGITLEQLFAGFDFPGLGIELFRTLIRAGYDSPEKIINNTFALPVEDWSTGRISVFRTYIDSLAPQIREMLDEEFIILKEESPVASGDAPLKDLRICVTGKLETMTRKEIEAFIASQGGSLDSSVTKNTNFLVTNDTTSGSSKLKSAEKFGTQILSEKEFLEKYSN